MEANAGAASLVSFSDHCGVVAHALHPAHDPVAEIRHREILGERPDLDYPFSRGFRRPAILPLESVTDGAPVKLVFVNQSRMLVEGKNGEPNYGT
jgi:hypothetical protein